VHTVSTCTQAPGKQTLLTFPLPLPWPKVEDEPSSGTHTHTRFQSWLKTEPRKYVAQHYLTCSMATIFSLFVCFFKGACNVDMGSRDTRIILFLLLNSCAFAKFFFILYIHNIILPSIQRVKLSLSKLGMPLDAPWPVALSHASWELTLHIFYSAWPTQHPFLCLDDWLSSIAASVTPP